MKIAVIAANGRVGQRIVQEGILRGLNITAIAREENKTTSQSFIQKDLFDLTSADIEEFDILISAFGAWTPETLNQHSTSLQHLANIVSNTPKRLLVVGGAGSLYTDSTHTTQVMDSPDFPEDYKPLAMSMGKSLSELRLRNDVQWTYISPAADFQADGARTGTYTLAGEEFTVNTDGQSHISYADYAIAMIDEAIKGTHIQERISVLS